MVPRNEIGVASSAKGSGIETPAPGLNRYPIWLIKTLLKHYTNKKTVSEDTAYYKFNGLLACVRVPNLYFQYVGVRVTNRPYRFDSLFRDSIPSVLHILSARSMLQALNTQVPVVLHNRIPLVPGLQRALRFR
jgi:hypothetical protein